MRCTPVVPAFAKLRQEGCCDLRANLGYRVSSETAWTWSPMIMAIIVNSKGFPLELRESLGGKKTSDLGGTGKDSLSRRDGMKME